ncbi:redox-sensing transcriptional repressor Rex [Lactobacillus delbrueckii subsp. lactis]|jgi:redox-sensing transcriptional repressor|uniref:Redox-sensing transcriptional repressor Rex n=4 Tax=Lactobacillus TaxID=1578 RepID=A0A061CUV8_LACDL|nr:MULTISPECIES: redox-sensing transcriptional repressor Rex [Lactobacillus]ADQ61554.1 Redox-sensing transcriptional repressor rex [Lactobacillus delbrueckii subsp. bulgaricus ND02]APG66620.1 redox-sensing transcriptional repressor Rex [Lactobacillus delbrueckii subsp. lactis]APG71772.1 redox-sensing transcriptional repressor Rex [Lactobacillus delbrueckii subsp. delbrueckii]APG73696.1 redox-sensing transcriptional repressor Rex [Lactobacillus delbrueckii subsp. jakobsenii ZN7a-9 = DSM 26046]A
MNNKFRIPKATAKRLPLYYRYLLLLNDEGKDKVSSTELAEAVQVDSASIRRDFSYFGALGKRGYGYDVKNLLSFFKKILNQDTLTNVALVGVGNLGHALLNYNFKRSNNIRISCAFDINPEITGKITQGVPVYSMDEMKQQIADQQIRIAILTVPQATAQKTADEMIEAGIKGIMNFTPIRLSAPNGVRIQNVDLATELQTLIYFLDSDEMIKKQLEERKKAMNNTNK